MSQDENVNATNAQNVGTTQTKSRFGVSKDQQGGSIVPIPAPIKLDKHTEQFKTGYEFPVARLVSVKCDPKKEMTIGGVKEERPVLQFTFKDDKQRQFSHIEFPIDDDDAKFDSKMDWLNQRIKHIWDETIGHNLFPADGLGSNAQNFTEFYTEVENAFNSVKTGEGEAAKVLYYQRPVYIKLTYNKNRLQLPLFPNFLQRAMDAQGKQVPVLALSVDPSRDNIEPSASVNKAGYSGGTDNTFGATTTYAGGDFPDV